VRYILIDSRHTHPDLVNVPALFNSVLSQQIFDFDYHKRVIHNKLSLEKFAEGEELVLYVTGLTPLLISTINYCKLFDIVVVLKHYDSDTNTYRTQSVV